MQESDYNKILEERFKRGNARSEIYKTAYKLSLRFFLGKFYLLDKIESTDCPYQEGTVEFDAWFSGWHHGVDEAQHQRNKYISKPKEIKH